MHYEDLTHKPARHASKETVLSVCPAGVLESTVIVPKALGSARPLLALHGISRNASEVSEAMADAAEAARRVVVVPHFRADSWPVFQRVTRRARPDKTLLALLATLRAMDGSFQGPVDLFGFSGGAQLAHRFAMLYPEAIGDLHLGAAGWYTFPDTTAAYPYGVADCNHKPESWSRLMRGGLHAFLRRRITVYVGEEDAQRDASLRQNPFVDAQQGLNRRERALRYVGFVNERQAALGLPCTARLQLLSGCDHDFATCAAQGDLAQRVLNQAEFHSISPIED